MTTDPRLDRYTLASCKGCGAVGLVQRGSFPLCGRCLPNAKAIHILRHFRLAAAPKEGSK